MQCGVPCEAAFKISERAGAHFGLPRVQKTMKKIIALIMCLALVLCFAACGKNKGNDVGETLNYSSGAEENGESRNAEENASQTEAQEVNKDDETQKVDTYIILNDESTTINGKGASFSEGVLDITKAGVYSIKGTLSDGSIRVNVDEDKKVKIQLDGVTVSSTTTAPIYIENSNKETKLVLMNGTVNEISDTAGRTTDEDDPNYANAAIYSKDDIEICGSGTLNVIAKFGKGIFSKNDLQFSSGTVNVMAVDDAVRGKDSVEISGGVLNLTCGGDGIRTNNSSEDGKGSITISGGTVNVTSDCDGIQATRDVIVSGGTVSVKSGGGSTSDIKSKSPSAQFGGYNGFGNAGYQGSTSESDADEESTKALKSDGKIVLSGGVIALDSYDDAIHADGAVELSGAKLSISTNDDAVHSDESVTISGGETSVSRSYEGLEAQTIEISGGNTVVKAADDGLNTASASDQAENPYSFGGKGGPGGDSDSSAWLKVSGGRLVINSNGDGIDSNGSIEMTGGFVAVFGPTSDGDTAFDYGTEASITGGTLLAVGSAGMAEGLGSKSSYVYSNTSVSAGTLVTVTDEGGKELIAFVTPKNIENIIFFDESMKEGASYTISTGGTHSGEEADGIYSSGETSGSTQAASVTASASNGRQGFGGPPGGPGH